MFSAPPVDPLDPVSARGNRMQTIDALRGLAALMVLVTHASSSFSSHAIRHGYDDMLYRLVQCVDTGRIGVMVFFIVSGFVVANTLAAPSANLLKFAVRRVFRLYPLFWLSIVVVVLFLEGRQELIPHISDWKAIAANATMLPTLLGFDALMVLYWTLETEIVFYLVAAAVYKLGFLSDPSKLLVLIGGLIGIFAATMFGLLPAPASLAWKSLGLNLAFMFWGALFHAVFTKPTKTAGQSIQRPYPLVPLVLATAAILAPSAFTALRFLASGHADDLRWSIAYPTTVLLFATLYFAKGTWVRATARLGLVSYSMYLLHPAAIVVVSLLIEHNGFLASGAPLPLLTFAAVAVTVAMSMVSYALIEKPAIFLGKKLTTKSGAHHMPGSSASSIS